MNYLTIERAIRERADWYRCMLIPEAPVDYKGEPRTGGWSGGVWTPTLTYYADFISVTDAGYATEYEIKVSRGDWRKDQHKQKFGRLPSYISRFIYVVPEGLEAPAGVPEWAGIWEVMRDAHRSEVVKIVRQPKRIGKERVPQERRDYWIATFYYRFWRQRIDLEGRKWESIRRAARAA